MEAIQFIVNVFEVILFVYLGIAAIYILVFGVAGLFNTKPKPSADQKKRKIAVMIPGYKEDAVIVEVANDALKQDYPKNQFDVVVIADSFQPETIEKLKQMPIKLIEVSFEKSTKSKALNAAMAAIGDKYDIACILDADNLMETGFLAKINEAFNRGFMVVQGRRIAKNTNTAFAILDAISEEVNNHIFRKGHRVLGFSSALIGSGMAFDYHFFKRTMAEVNAVGGFDKELELRLLKDRKKIEYLNHAVVLDEKVQKPEVFANQRKRWLSAQFVYFRRYFFTGIKHLFKHGNLDLFDKVYQMVSPPRVLLLGLVSIIALLYVILNLVLGVETFLLTNWLLWLCMAVVVYLAFVVSVPLKFYNLKTLKAVLTLPKAFFIMFLSLFKLKGANKKFIHTAHGVEK
jgi:cellulose synthase/poly-beta-1,6-N-acetylglucosamine synthase-like glycosyltransferase